MSTMKSLTQRYENLAPMANETVERLRGNRDPAVTVTFTGAEAVAALGALGNHVATVAFGLTLATNGDETAIPPEGLQLLDNLLDALSALQTATVQVPDELPDWV